MQGNSEMQESFIPTPEKISPLMGPDFKIEELHGEFKSVEGRNRIFQQIMQNEEQLRLVDPKFNPENLRMQLEAVGEALSAEERFFQQQNVPEKKTLFKRAMETVTGFPRNHPVLTAVLLISILAGMALNMGWLNGLGFGTGSGSWWNGISNWFTGSAVAEGTAEAATVGAEAVEGVTAAAPDATAAAVEAAKAALPQTLDIHTVGHSIIYDGQTYSMEQFKDIWPSIVESKGDNVIQVIRDASSRTTTEQTIEELFRGSGLTPDQLKWTDNFSNGAAD